MNNNLQMYINVNVSDYLYMNKIYEYMLYVKSLCISLKSIIFLLMHSSNRINIFQAL